MITRDSINNAWESFRTDISIHARENARNLKTLAEQLLKERDEALLELDKMHECLVAEHFFSEQQAKIDELERQKDSVFERLGKAEAYICTGKNDFMVEKLEESRLQIQAQKKVVEKAIQALKRYPKYSPDYVNIKYSENCFREMHEEALEVLKSAAELGDK